MPQISKPSDAAVSQQAYVLTLETTASTTIEAQFMSVSLYGNATSGTFTVQVGSNPVQTLPGGAVFSLPYVGKPYTQSIVVSGGGATTVDMTVIY